MKLKSLLAKPYASLVHSRIRKEMELAVSHQEAIMHYLLKNAAKTSFGTEHRFASIRNYEEYKAAVPIRDYEAFSPYIDKIKGGQQNVLWKGKPMYFAKTSGTTSGTKYIPISKDSIHN
ncbi:MAG: GH3 auxin-responsive promoter family protein, partial [Taibaiella sp.]|nr:GH3 auxin-responsive promoter family protein [Taibaiella sp.]